MFDDILTSPSSPKLESSLIQGLNDTQRLAVETTEGPLLILAGAGTGKTRVLTTRFAHILTQKLAQQWQILAVTFTNKAAKEMKERLNQSLGGNIEGLWLGTFHSLCARMLRRHSEYVGLSHDFTVLDTDDQIRLLKQIIPHYQLDPKKDTPQKIINKIQNWKDRALLPHHLLSHNQETKDCYAEIYADYQRRLVEINACDFGDLILHMVRIFQENHDILAIYHQRFKYIMVDEYQDTNTIQYLWLRLLSKKPQEAEVNIACVGDDDQSIYSWRGADINNILRFEKDFHNAKIIRLEKNYRSTPNILATASKLIAHNKDRLGKTLYTGDETQDVGDKVLVVHADDSDEEARLIGEMIEQLSHKGYSSKEIALLVRAGFQTRSFEDAFMKMNIPYRVIGGVRFYERAEIRDAVAYMRVLMQPRDDLAFERIVNLPKRAFGAASLNKLRDYAVDNQLSLQNALKQQLEKSLLKGKVKDNFTSFFALLEQARLILKENGHILAVDHLLEKSGYRDIWRNDSSIEAAGRLDNLHELLRAMGEFPSIESFLEHVALVMDVDALNQDDDYVNIMTLHASKGLEFDCVFLPGWEENIFPSQRSLEEDGEKALEEERRLAYVGITRARKKLIILHASSRMIYGRWEDSEPSRFLKELPQEHILHQERARRHTSLRRSSSFGSYNRETIRSSIRNSIMLGTLVKHPRYGTGVVTYLNNEFLTVNFEKVGIKRVIADFVEIIS